MHRFALLLLLVCLALPAAALAGRTAPGDGSLVVSNAVGVLTIDVKGVIYGHFDRGKMTVLEWKADTPNALPSVSGAKMDVKGAKVNVVYTGSDVRFLFPSGKYKLKFDAAGIDLSVVGGATLRVTKSSLDDGTMVVNGGKPTALTSVVTIGLGTLSVTAEKAGSSDKGSTTTTSSSSTGR